jgi:hypothetical protein
MNVNIKVLDCQEKDNAWVQEALTKCNNLAAELVQTWIVDKYNILWEDLFEETKEKVDNDKFPYYVDGYTAMANVVYEIVTLKYGVNRELGRRLKFDLGKSLTGGFVRVIDL